jgi:hypothetical protein
MSLSVVSSRSRRKLSSAERSKSDSCRGGFKAGRISDGALGKLWGEDLDGDLPVEARIPGPYTSPIPPAPSGDRTS